MTVWDNIYKDYQKGGEAWATIKEGLIPSFVSFVESNEFNLKRALDIGCGTGKYLVYLKSLGFEVTGIDSSETSIEMTKKLVGEEVSLSCDNMFDFDILKNKYDFIFSISTIHHGRKEQVVDLINRIYDSLSERGKVFITLPDIETSNQWDTFKDHEEIAPGTYVPTIGPEKGLAHSFFAKNEVENIFSRFKDVNIERDEIGRWIIIGEK
jgi:2-polyprenyl-3-methyl-5-hydroxy-6-metoxy-1,4-benzoquinol methylase